MQNFVQEYLNPLFELLNYNLFALGDAKITPLSLLYVVIFAVVLLYLSNKLKGLLISRLLTRTRLDTGAQDAIGTIARYVILVVGFLILIQSIGINLTTLNVLAGAVGVGVGFGLQNIANNFISGLIILLERPIKVGDRVEVDDVSGDVITIGARSSTIRTNDNIAIIVPNSKFISENVTNWSFVGDTVRFRIPIGVSYDSDVDLVERLLLEIAEQDPNVVSDPPAKVRLVEFGDNSLNFELWAWTRSRLNRPGAFKSGLNFAIIRKFREHNIEIPFPQRDVHFRSGDVHVVQGQEEHKSASA
ncbi:MAG: mechanosensitive ion channel domain-containing protein [Pyrinomonadaceae bacterium]